MVVYAFFAFMSIGWDDKTSSLSRITPIPHPMGAVRETRTLITKHLAVSLVSRREMA